MPTFFIFLFLLSIIVFWLARLAPGDPLMAYYGETAERMNEPQRILAMERLSLNKPAHIQYLTWLGNALSGDFGLSHQYKQDVLVIIKKMLPNTFLLGGISYILTFSSAILLGIFCAFNEGSAVDKAIYRIGMATSVIPSFFISLIAILVFSINLKIFPTSGAYSLNGGGPADRLYHLALPAMVMAFSHLWYYAYIIRNRMIEELQKDYVLLLRVKRLSNARILFCHCLRNALPMLITIMSLSIPHIIMGTYVIETVFNYPGIGSLIFESARFKDFNMLSILTLMTGLITISSNTIGQALSELLDPRMRHAAIVKGVGNESR